MKIDYRLILLRMIDLFKSNSKSKKIFPGHSNPPLPPERNKKSKSQGIYQPVIDKTVALPPNIKIRKFIRIPDFSVSPKVYEISNIDNTYYRNIKGAILERCDKTGQLIIYNSNGDIIFIAPKELIIGEKKK